MTNSGMTATQAGPNASGASATPESWSAAPEDSWWTPPTDGVYVNVPALALLGGGVELDEATPEDNTLVAASANTLGVYFGTGTRDLSLRLLEPLAFVGTFGPAGEVALRYGPRRGGCQCAGPQRRDRPL
jgi:hypothetical protein